MFGCACRCVVLLLSTPLSAVWLKGKGDDFYRSGDFSSAVNAYSAAIELDSAAVGCLSNRAACYLHLHKLEECVADCGAALALTPPPQPSPQTAAAAADEGGKGRAQDAARALQSRVRLLARRGTALSQLGRFSDAMADFQAAGALDRSDPTFATIASELSRLAECTWQCVDSDCDCPRCALSLSLSLSVAHTHSLSLAVAHTRILTLTPRPTLTHTHTVTA